MKRKKKKSSSFAKKYLVLAFILLVGVVGAFYFFTQQKKAEQEKVDKLILNAGYPEMKGKAPTFRTDIATPDSLTHVISYLPEDQLRRDNFDEKAAQNLISYIEQFAKKQNTFKFNPYITEGPQISVTMVPRNRQPENFVFITSEEEPISSILENGKDSSVILKDAIENKKSFFFTVLRKKGSTTFLRFADTRTWINGLPTADKDGLTPMEQLNLGFNIETWRRSSAILFPADFNLNPTERTNLLLNISDSMWNTFGQLTAAKEENVPPSLMERRLNERKISTKSNSAYYPFDVVAKTLYSNAPKGPIIR